MTQTLQQSTEELLRDCISISPSRVDFWVEFLRRARVQRMVEVGVYQGDFAAVLLERGQSIEKYYMIDPWRHLEDWNKPANEDDNEFVRFFQAAKAKTEFAASRRVILRGKTTEVIDQIPDRELDFAYIDGDHTLKGIAIDLVRVFPKVRPGGYIGGDDFTPTIWQHNTSFEPTLVFPFAVYFAEAMGATIFALPNSQFCMQKTDRDQFSFVDLTGDYRDLTLRNQMSPKRLLKTWLREQFPKLSHFAGKARRLISSRK
jgi:hypothetical protein